MTSYRLKALALGLSMTAYLGHYSGLSHAADPSPLDGPASASISPDTAVASDSSTKISEGSAEKHLPKAQNVALDQPIDEPPAEPATTEADTPDAKTAAAATTQAKSKAANQASEAAQTDGPLADSVQEAKPEEPHLVLLGTEVPPATSTRLSWAPSQSFEGIYSATPVLVVNGAKPGPTLCLTAAVHGDELNGVETVRRVLYNLDANTLKGTVIGVPIVNLQGFHRSSRYLSDRRDLNRYFPGDPQGSSASRIAYSFFHELIKHCSAVVDLHTGSFYRTNLPQLRGDLLNPQVLKLTQSFGSTVVLHSEGTSGTLRRAAVDAGIPAVTLEAGAPMVLDEESVSHSVKGIRTLLNHLGMVSKFRLWGDPEPVYYNSTWQRAPQGGIVFSKVSLGQVVRKGDTLATVTNPITNVRTKIRSSYNGRVLGMALNQVVQPGFATHHIGIEASGDQFSKPQDVDIAPANSAQEKPQHNAATKTAEDAALLATQKHSDSPESEDSQGGDPREESLEADEE
ncbi:succinylglutamate desuccinylase/aspartoacylase family protein [Parahaliea sp. F7430]|uniref:Succinylglutamate desuccinylase/aspartoacylase family protein n=2 Tax=Sediminihaliea albiluteola TaxID=2758564 RepID=A0A7W2YJB0_9GAMM|nr:succinylglutamate desuccinylase/aspartoacylase family protein [Sediminihaliea albiluteola]